MFIVLPDADGDAIQVADSRFGAFSSGMGEVDETAG